MNHLIAFTKSVKTAKSNLERLKDFLDKMSDLLIVYLARKIPQVVTMVY